VTKTAVATLDAGRLYESGYKTRMKKKRYLIDVQISSEKSSKQRKTRHRKTPVKSNIVSIASCVWLFLLDFPQTEIAC